MAKTFAEKIKRLRQDSYLTQKEASELCGVSLRTYLAWESGATVPIYPAQRGIMEILTETRPDERGKERQSTEIPEPSNEDALALADVLRALVHGGGHGQLKATASELGMTASAFRKRLIREGAGLDEASIKAVILVADRKDELYEDWQVRASNNIGGYVITTRALGVKRVVTWRLAPGKSISA